MDWLRTRREHQGTGGSMSMAEDTRKRPDFSSDYSSPAREQGEDPLAEIARLIGQSDRLCAIKGRGPARNPLDAMRSGDRPAPEWLARPAPPADRHDDHYADEPPAAPHDDYRAESYQTPDDHGHAPQDQYRDQYDDTA